MGSTSRNTIPLLVLVLAFAAIALAQQNEPRASGGPATAPANAAPTSAQPQSEQVEGTATVMKVKTRLVLWM